MKPLIAVQYLEHHTPQEHTPEAVRRRLRDAFDRLPISLVLLGWNTPRPLVDTCAEITVRNQARLFLWHPLLTSDGVFVPLLEWRTVGLNGESIAGYRGDPEFTFACPNRPAVHEAVIERLSSVLHGSPFQGVFLDRIRFPSPAPTPDTQLGCFCPACYQAASQEGLDLAAVQHYLVDQLAQPEAGWKLVENLLAPCQGYATMGLLESFLDFRQHAINRLVQEAASIVTALGMSVGLDCFSPRLARLVGQDLSTLNTACEWVKIMTYTHTLAPAGLPFELLGLAGWLSSRYQFSRPQALRCLAEASRLPLGASVSALRRDGLPPQAISAEIKLGRSMGIRTLLVGTALVDLPGVNSVRTEQHMADLEATRSADADGLVLSWDLWHISPERLEQVANTYLA